MGGGGFALGGHEGRGIGLSWDLGYGAGDNPREFYSLAEGS